MAIENMKKSNSKILLEISGIVDESLDLLKNKNIHGATQQTYEKLPSSLLDQCLELSEQYSYGDKVLVRTLHHFGLPQNSPLFSSLATLANTSVLKDLHPSINSHEDSIKSQTLVAESVINDELLVNSLDENQINVFLTDLQQKVHDRNRLGQQILICDNPCLSDTSGENKQDLLTLLNRQFCTRSLIIIADPVDSYRAYCQLSYPEKTGLNFEEYCQCVLEFIFTNSALTVIKHEDFIAKPDKVMMEICEALELPFNQSFMDLKGLFKITQSLQKTKVTDLFAAEYTCSSYLKLCDLLGYETQVNSTCVGNENDDVVPNTFQVCNTNLVKDSQSELIRVIKIEINAELQAAKFNPYAHNRTMTQDWNEKLREFAEIKLNIKDLKPVYIDYLGKKVIHIERNCVGRLATTIQDAVTRQLVAQSVLEDNLSILEIGALYGIGLAILYNHGITRFKGVEVVCLDPFDGYYGHAFDPHLNCQVNDFTFVRNMELANVPTTGYQIIKKYSTDPEAISKIKTISKINLLIIDGDHSYDGIKFDFENYYPLLSSGGYIIFDDYNAKEWPGVQKFIDEEIKTSTNLEYIGDISRTAVVRKK